MTDLAVITNVILDDDRFKIIGVDTEKKDMALFFSPREEMFDVFTLERMVRTLFSEIPEKTSIVSTHGGIVMMTCSERSNDVKIPPRSISVQCFLSEVAALKDFHSSLR